MTENSQDRWRVSLTARWGTTSIIAKTIAGPRIDSTEPCSGWNRQCATFARFSELGDFRVFQHNQAWSRHPAARQRLPFM